MTNSQTQIALGIVIEGNDALVIERRQREIGRNGKPIVWAFPGGKLEAGETPEEAAIREVEEETGYIIESNGTITSENHPQYPVYVHYIGCKLLAKTELESLPDSIVEVDWVPTISLGKLFNWRINEKVQDYIQAHIS